MSDIDLQQAFDTYNQIHKLGRQPNDFELKVNDKICKCTFVCEGGTKRAFDLHNGSVLLTPQRECCCYNFWNRICTEEVYFSDLYQRLGLLTPESKLCTMSLVGNDLTLPSYTSRSFSDFALDNAYVQDMKNTSTCYWKKNLFPESADLTKPDVWLPAVDKYIDDIIVIAQNSLSLGGDTFNYVVVLSDTKYIIRPFSFDFSSKSYERECQPKTTLTHFDAYQMGRIIRSLSSCISDFANFELAYRQRKPLVVVPTPWVEPAVEPDETETNIHQFNWMSFDGADVVAWKLLPIVLYKLNLLGITYEMPLTTQQEEARDMGFG